jgi:hypothetical protein
VILATPMDFFENVILLRMLASPLEFPDWMAIAYSGFAALKSIFLKFRFNFSDDCFYYFYSRKIQRKLNKRKDQLENCSLFFVPGVSFHTFIERTSNFLFT